ncbi:hypothetical protein GOODEAATRI_017199 [Goodea atripinnis]|uniref:Peptidase M12B domain-containing protein n=1 Tax=Goodea atripinnis TaxID=208336 RepID=A0ABV0N274_9TELE
MGICSGISGFLRVQQQLYLIEPLGQAVDEEHAVYKWEHVKTSGGGSSSNSTLLFDRDLNHEQGPQPEGLFRSRSWLYRSVNIRIMLVGLEIWSYRDHIDMDGNSDITLDNFLVWRQADLLQRAKHDNAQLDHHDNPLGLASTIAHEMGHNFGLTGGQAFPDFFSNCSIQQLAQFMERAQPSCLHPPGRISTITVGPRCGNALLDSGEECDCGTAEVKNLLQLPFGIAFLQLSKL